MEKKGTSFLLTESDATKITKTSLSALIQRRAHNAKEYPAEVVDIINGTVFVRLMPPVLRSMQREHTEAESSHTMRAEGENLREGDHVLLQCQGSQWYVSTTLSEDIFLQRLENSINEQLLFEAEIRASAIVRRSARRRFEGWLQLQPTESTPWAFPGRIVEGQHRTSKKIGKWCRDRGGEELTRAFRKGLPKIKDWGRGPLYFGIFPEGDALDTFTAVVIPKDEHRALVEAWSDLLKQPAKQIIPKEVSIAPPSPPPVDDGELLLPASTIMNFQPLPPELSALIRGFHLPFPEQPINETLATLAAWSQSDHPALKERSTDFFLMLLAEGEPVRPNSEMRQLWTDWHNKADPIERLCEMIKSGEEAAAIRGLVGRSSPGPLTAASISDHLILRWRRHLVRTHNLDIPLRRDKLTPPTLEQYRRAMRLRGIRCPDTFLDRLLLCAQTACEMGMMVIFSGSQNSAQTIIRILEDVFRHSKSDIVRLPRQRSHLLGRPSREKDLFNLSDFSKAIRRGGHLHNKREPGVWNPYFLLLENIEQYAKRDGLSLTLQKAYFGKGARLFSEEENQRFLDEFMELQSKSTLSPEEIARRDLLEEFYSSEMLGGRSLYDAWRLHASGNTMIFGVLSREFKERSLDIVKRSIVLKVPDIDPDEINDLLNKRRDEPNRLIDIPRRRNPKSTWNKFPIARDQILEILPLLQKCNVQVDDVLAKQVSFLLAGAESWEVPDSPLLSSHIIHSILLPRIRCLGNQAINPLKQMQKIKNMSPELQKTLSQLITLALVNRNEIINGLMI